MNRQRWTHYTASTIASFESSRFLPVARSNNLAYATPVENEESLHHRIEEACQTIRNYSGIFQRSEGTLSDVLRRALSLMRNILSTDYECTPSAITNELNFSGNTLIWTLFLFWYMELVSQVCLHI
jgi:hypothetical protein